LLVLLIYRRLKFHKRECFPSGKGPPPVPKEPLFCFKDWHPSGICFLISSKRFKNSVLMVPSQISKQPRTPAVVLALTKALSPPSQLLDLGAISICLVTAVPGSRLKQNWKSRVVYELWCSRRCLPFRVKRHIAQASSVLRRPVMTVNTPKMRLILVPIWRPRGDSSPGEGEAVGN
jgi:hypothetical protein